MRKLYFLLFFMGLSVAALAQESSCSDGVDNDGDGFIDCFDGDCGGNIACQGTYIGNDADCEIPQPPGSNFSMVLENQSEEHVSSTHGRFVIGDMGDPVNGKDGIPEIVTAHTSDRKIYILDGQTLDIKYEATSPNRIDRYDIAIADVTNSGCAQIFVAEVATEQVCVRYRSNGSCREYEDVTKHYVSSWDCQANFLWRTEVYARPFTLALADFDADGKAELYFRNQILDAATGQVIIAGSGNWSNIDGGPVAVDILDDSECADCAGLELVAGGQIYSVNLNAPGALDGGALTLVREFNNVPGLTGNDKWSTKFLDLDNDEFVNSQTSIADFDQDGFLDVLMTGTSNGGKTTIFYWNVHNNTADVYRPSNNWKYGAGRLNLADLDGDGEMNVAFVTGNYLYALDENLDLLWRIAIDEETSGYTSTTVFDFNNDGASEIVYRDETYLYIIKGDGTFSPPINCKSLTSNDYPIVADVDADGSTEICVICQDNFNDSNYAGANEGVIRTYKSGNEPWVSARKVWNQHGYFNVNVNDDLTIPIVQQKHHLVFSEDQCGPGENRVLNSFLNQSAILNSDGCKTYPSADITFVPNPGPDLISITPPQCPDQDFLVSFTIRNVGSLDINATVPVTFYSGDPRLAGAVKLGTEDITLSNFKTGDQIDVTDMTVTGTGGAFTLFAVLNDDGSSIPTPIVLPNTDLEECNIGNNLASAAVNPRVFQLSTSSTDHVQCGVVPSPPNGSVRAFKLEGGVEQTVGYTFYWFDGTTAGASGSADHVGSDVTGLADGTYMVYALHDAFQCGSDTVQVAVGRDALSISATVSVDQPYTNCNSPDGQLSVTPDSGNINDYSYEWFEGTVFGTSPTLSDSSVLKFTQALTYSVLVTQLSSGCATLESGTVPDLTVTPVVNTSFVPANCAPPNSGQVSAEVGGATAGYTFYWYDGSTSKPTEDYLGHTYSNVTAGNYTVVATDNTTGCSSTETVATVSTVTGITVSANITAQQTSCATPNGAASAHVNNTTAGYSFRWFQGNNTINQIGTNPTISGLAAGDYTVQATNLATGCTDTELITIVDNILVPTVAPSVVSQQTNCFPPNGAVSAAAAGSPGPYQYYWFDGNVGTPDTTTADFKGANYPGLTAGFYTVVAVDVNSRCGSARGVVEVLDQTVNPVITSNTVQQTSCNALAPNGGASANVGGNTANYKFRWFVGADTTTFVAQAPSIANQPAGTYTVKAISRATGCFSTRQVTITNNLVTPVVTAVVDQNLTVCNANNGQVSASVGGVTSGFDFHWFNGNPAAPDSTAANFEGAVYANRPVGAYTVIAVNRLTRCVSAKRTVNVTDATVAPAVATVPVQQTSCNPLAPNGSASANAGGVTAGYRFRWFSGTDTTTFITEAVTMSNRVAGTYTVKAINIATGCFSLQQTTITNNLVTPVVTAVVDQNLTVCNANNGQVSASVGGGTSGFDFNWFNGNPAAPDSTAANFEGAVYANRPVGAFTVIAVNKHTRCVSAKRTVNVTDATVAPSVATIPVQQTSCNPLAPNGSASANVGGVTAGYRFRWFSGTDTTTFITEAVTVNNRVAGTYTVKAINIATGCFSLRQTTVTNNLVTPVVTAMVDQNLTVCNENNGQVSANVGGVTSGFDFYWFNGNPAAPDSTAANFEGAVYANRPVGAFTVIAVNKLTRCVSAKSTVNVTDATVPPAVATVPVQQTSCNPLTPNGSASANVGGVTAGYRFRWFSGTDTTAFITEAVTVTNRVAGTYTVKAIDIATGCFSLQQTTITNNFVMPVVTAVVDQNLTVCNANNGQVSASVGGVTSGFDFYWFNGNPAVPDSTAASFEGAVYANRPVGAFTVIAVNKLTRCLSAKRTVNVLNNTVPPVVVAVSPDDNTACDPALSNGSISANVGGVTTNHIFHIFRGQNTNPLNEVVGSPSAMISTLPAGVYTVQAIDNVTGCAGTTEVTVENNIVLPTLNAISTNVTDCSPANGTITASVSIGDVGDYTFAWFTGDDEKAVTDYPGETTHLLTGLTAGFYTFTAFNNELGCDVQGPFTIDVINDPSTDITVTDVPADLVPGAICNDGNGQLGVQASSPSNVSGFTFSWFQGDDESGMVFVGNGSAITPSHSRMSGISSGRYTVIAVDNDTGCQDSLEIDLPYVGEALLVSIITAPQTNCAVPDGSFEAVITPGPIAIGLGANQASYRLDVFQNGALIQSVPGVEPAPTIVTGLAAGNYTVLAVETQVPPLTGCASTPNNIVINDATDHPVLTFTSTDNQNCIGAALENGSISLDVDAGGNPNDYTFDWHDGKTMIGPALPGANVPAPGNAAINIGSGFYTVEVVNTLNGCETVGTFHIGDDPHIISILDVDLNIAHQTDCSPENGLAEVMDVKVDGVSAGVAGFTFEWFDNDGIALIPGSGATAVIGTSLGFGNYYVRATDPVSNCESTLKQFVVLDQTTPPAIAPTVVTNNSNCVGSTPNGSLTIEVNGGAALSDFTIEWFEGNGTGTPLGTNFGSVSGADGETAIDLPAGTYTVQVTDNTTPGNSCIATSTFTIVDDLPVIAIDNADITIAHQTDCAPVNGSAQVTDVLVDGIATAVADFSFEWFENDGTTLIAGGGNGSIVGVPLAAGDYFVRATSGTSSCESPMTGFTVNDVHVDPVISLSASVNNSNCAGSTPNGSLTIEVNGGAVLSDFTIEWFEGSGTGTPLGTNFGSVSGADGETAIDLPAGTYSVQVTDNTTPGNNCVATSTFTIVDDLPVIAIDGDDITIVHQTDCAPVNASAQVTDVLVNGVATAVADFNFEWFENDGTTPIAGAGNGPIVGVPLAAGDYFVRATSGTSSCESPMTGFTVNDVHVDPVISLSASVNNSNCTGSTPNGSLTVEVNGGAALSDFTIEWFEGSGTGTPLGTNFGSVSGADGETAIDLPAGTYSVQVTDNTTPGNNCVATSTFTIVNDLPVIGIDNLDIAVSHQTDCVPANGSAQVTEVTLNGAGLGNVAGYTFEWLEADRTTLIPGTGNGSVPGIALAPGLYTVRATDPTSSCSSSPTAFTIEDHIVRPAADIVMVNPNIGCDLNFTGELSVSVTEGTTPNVTAGYSFDWFTGKNNTNPADLIGSGISLSSLAEGDYTVRVTDTASPGLGCIATASLPVEFEVTQFSTSLTSVVQANCAPLPDGSLTVNTVTETIEGTSVTYSMANAADRVRFNFQWFDASLNPLPATPSPVNGLHSVANLAAGQYYVTISNLMGCTATLTEGIIDDETVFPAISLDNFDNPAVCVLPETPGYLQVSADNNPNFSDYTFEWFEGPDDTGALVQTGAELLNIAYNQPLEYTVRVTNNNTNCVSLDTYRFKVDTVKIQVLASAVARTNCVVDDGSLFATTLNGTGALYNYEWYAGPAVSGTPIFTTKEVTGAPVGQYTVIAVNPNHAFCNSTPYTTRVTDERVLPPVVAVQRNPLTYCDPANPNGVAFASVNNQVVGYTFDWFQGAVGAVPMYTGPEVKGLAATTYVVRATHMLTGCEQTASILIQNAPVNVPEPTVVVVSHHTNCLVPDGILAASVNGTTAGYLLQWYDGNVVRSTADETGEFYRDLEDGSYTVTATDLVSGCVSGPVTAEVLPFREDPEFTVVTTPTNCEENIGEAAVEVLNDVQLSSIEWSIGNVIEFGARVGELPKGEFEVTVTTYRECTATNTFIIEPEVLVFNGVSRNNDGQNDKFEIACIQDFPQNNVKIFNRAGTLVYEANGYDNQDVYFDGVSNRGISLLGTDLPDGTYFFIIDKRNGSKPRTGYLELLK